MMSQSSLRRYFGSVMGLRLFAAVAMLAILLLVSTYLISLSLSQTPNVNSITQILVQGQPNLDHLLLASASLKNSELGTKYIKYEITELVIFSKKPVCVTSIFVSFKPDYLQSNGPIKGVCSKAIDISSVKDREKIINDSKFSISDTGTVDIETNPQLYPYDTITFEPEIYIYGYYPDEHKNEDLLEVQAISWKLIFPTWEVELPKGKINTTGTMEIEDRRLKIELKRPLIYRFLSPILLLILLLFITLTVFIKDTGSFAQVAVAILFGIWSARQILIPQPTAQTNILEQMFLIVYFYLALASFTRTIIIPLISKNLSMAVANTQKQNTLLLQKLLQDKSFGNDVAKTTSNTG